MIDEKKLVLDAFNARKISKREAKISSLKIDQEKLSNERFKARSMYQIALLVLALFAAVAVALRHETDPVYIYFQLSLLFLVAVFCTLSHQRMSIVNEAGKS